MFARIDLLIALYVLLMREQIAWALVDFKVVIDKCPPGFEKISNGCYSFSNWTSVTGLSQIEADKKCAEYSNTTTAAFKNTTLFHLLSLEVLGESISIYYYLKGGSYNQSFWLDTERTFGWDWRFRWSGHKFISHGFISDLMLKQNGEEQNSMYLYRNTSKKYEFRAANLNGDSSTRSQRMGYICEASLLCNMSDPHYLCLNNGTCYINTGKVMCLCPPGYTGYLCEIVIDACDSSPCLNGGNCSSSINNYTCDCSGLFFNGMNCENEITDPNEEYRLIAWSVFLGILGGLILFLCIMDFPLTYLVNKFNEKKKMVMSKHLARKEAKGLKKQLKEEKARIKEEMIKRNEAKKVENTEIRAERFLTTEEEMLRRFKKALEKSGQTYSVKKAEPKKTPSKPSYFAPVLSEKQPIPEYIEQED